MTPPMKTAREYADKVELHATQALAQEGYPAGDMHAALANAYATLALAAVTRNVGAK